MHSRSETSSIDQNFLEVIPPLTRDDATVEANRCLFCFDAPCAKACPTHIDIPSFIKKIATGNLRGSARVIMESNPLGPTCARVCPVEALCEGGCVYNAQGRPPIQIGRLQRHATDWLIASGETTFRAGPSNGRSVGLVGAGPASLAAAVRLREWGYDVDVYEAQPKGGGLDTYGIVSFRLPVDVSLAEVSLVERLGARFHYNTPVGVAVTIDELLARHDAVFVAVGLGVPPRLNIDGEDLPGVLDALPFIEETKTKPAADVKIGRHVVVIGAGNTAIDAATAARRLGAETVSIVYRRSAAEMTCYAFEYEFAKQDGVHFQWLTAPLRIAGTDRVEGLECIRTKLGKPDDGGRAKPVPIPGTEFTLPCDTVIKAIGQGPIRKLFDHLDVKVANDRIVVNEDYRTSRDRLFAAGDCVDGRDDATVVAVVAMALRAAAGIDRSLKSPRGTAEPAVGGGAPVIRPVHVLPSTTRSL
jgi:dihydropyrimidine dehydrogenase (NAD+) subunit PreT